MIRGEVGVLDQAASVVLDVSGIGLSIEHAVDDAYYFCASDDGIGTEGPVAVAADPAGAVQFFDGVLGPVAVQVAEALAAFRRDEFRGDACKFSAGYGGVRAEGAVRVAGDDAEGA